MKAMYQGKEIELEEATDEEIGFDYLTPDELNDPDDDLENTIELSKDMLDLINGEDNNE